MATLKISMVDTPAGPRITVDYESDRDALGHEHERDHRAAVAALLGVGLAELEALGITVERAGSTLVDDGCGCEEPVAPQAPTPENQR